MEAFDTESLQQIASSICSDENLTDSSNGYLLKGNLTKAVNLHYNGASVDFASGSELFDEELPVKYLELKEQEKSFKIPVTLNNIGSLTKMSQCRSSEHTWELDASKVYGSNLEHLDISSLVAINLQLPKEMEIEAKFSSLILYNGGNGFTHSLGSSFVEGKFGAAILQVPVEAGHEGGNLNVEYEGRKKLFESHQRSDVVFYLTAFYDGCEHFMEPISRGFKLVLVYDLLWTNSTNEIPRNFPVFLEASKQIKESLRPWRNRFQLFKSKMEIEKRENLVEKMKEPTAVSSEVHQDSTEPIEYIKNQGNVLFVENSLQENVFFFVLQESYEGNILSFLLLQEQDRDFANILLSCDFLDVNLANATQSSSEVQKGIVDVIEISQVIDSDEITRNLSIKLEWDKNCVGLVPSYPKKKLQEGNSEDSIADAKKNLHHGVLLIWPKHNSVQMYCRYRQDSVEPNVDAFASSSIHSKGILLDRLHEFWNPSVEHEISTAVGSIRSISDYEYQLRDFESAYEEVSHTAVVSANPIPGDLKKQLIFADNDAQDKSSASAKTSSLTKCFNESGPKVSDSVVWKGALVSKFSGKVNLRVLEMIGSQSIPLMEMPSTLELQVRISFKTFLDHVNLTRSQNRDVFFVPFLPIEKEQEMYFSFMKNLKLVGRVFVIKPFSEHIKNYYLVILQKDDAALKDLIPFSQKNDYLKDQTHDMLLGVALSAKKRSY